MDAKDSVTARWKELSEMHKLIVWAIGIGAALVIWLSATFETRADSEEKWQNHIQGNQCVKVAELRIQLRLLLAELEDERISPARRDKLKREIAIYEQAIRDLDPNRRCLAGG